MDRTIQININLAREHLRYVLGREPTQKEVINEISLKFQNTMKSIKDYKINVDLINNFGDMGRNPYLKTTNFLFYVAKLRMEMNVCVFDEEGNSTCLKHAGILDASHLFTIVDKNIINLIMNTNNKIIKRKLPFRSIFINNHFKIDNCTINGVLVYCTHNKEGDVLGKTVTKDNINLAYFCVGKDNNDGTEFFKFGFLEEFDNFINDKRTSMVNSRGAEFDLRDLVGLDSKIRLLICNLLDFINNPEVEIVTIERTKEQNTKRIKRGKLPLPPISYVKVTGKLKIYLDQLNSNNSFSYGHKFWVRGHFRTLRNEYRYGDKVGTRIWIYPFIKGQGILIDKTYRIKENVNGGDCIVS